MAINIFFIFLFTILSGALPAGMMYYLAIAQCIIGMYTIYTSEKYPITPLFGYYFSVMICSVANIYLISIVGTPENESYRYIVADNIDEATRITCIGNSCIFLGFTAAKHAKMPSIAAIVKNDNFYRILYYILLSIILYTFFFTAGKQEGSKVIYNIVKLLNLSLIIIFVRIWQLEKNITYRNYAIICTLLETVNALFNSYLREELIAPTLIFYLGYVISGRIERIISGRIIPLAIVLVTYFSVFTELEKNRAHFIDAFYYNPIYHSAVLELEPEKARNSGLLLRSANLAQVTNCVKLVDKNGFYFGSVSYPLLIALIPRDLYPDKPTISIGRWFALEIGVAVRLENSTEKELKTNNSVNMTIPGELYLDFGYIGIVLGCIFTGAFIMMLWNATGFYQSPYNVTGTLFGGYMLFFSFLGIGADLQNIVTFLSVYLTIYLLSKLL